MQASSNTRTPELGDMNSPGTAAHLLRQSDYSLLNLTFLSPLVYLAGASLLHLRYIQATPAQLARQAVLPLMVLAFACVLGLLALLKSRRFNRRLLVVFLGGFALLEGSARHFLPERDPFADVAVTRSPAPYTMFAGKPDGRVTIPDFVRPESGGTLTWQLNALGFRDEKVLAMPKPEDEIRIVVLGGSTAFVGEPIANTLPNLLQEQFHLNGFDRVKVYNCSVIAYVSPQELALLMYRLVDYDPDIVLVYDGANDLTSPWSHDPRPGFPYNFAAFEAADRHFRNPPLSDLCVAALRKSRFLSLGFKDVLVAQQFSLDDTRKRAGYGSQAWEEAIAQSYLANVDRFCRLKQGYPFKLAHVLQPLLPLKTPLVGKEEEILTRCGDHFSRYVRRQYTVAREGLAEAAARYPESEDCYFRDLSGLFTDNNQELFWDFVHVHEQGNALIAEGIFDAFDWNALLTP